MGPFVKSSYLALAAVAGSLVAAGHANAEDKKYVVGVSNTLTLETAAAASSTAPS